MHADTINACENCGTVLQGQYCHACGQNANNPLKHVSHAVEEVFESFWHLDGRAFRTLRDLVVPGRVACNYLAGQRVRYIQPLRLFLVLTLLTFFVGRLLFGGGGSDAIGADTGGNVGIGAQTGVQRNAFANAATEADVIRLRDKSLAGLAEGRADIALVPGAAKAMDRAAERMRADAEVRIAQLRKARGANAGPTSGAPASKADPDVDVDVKDADPETSIDTFLRRMQSAHLKNPKARWNAASNPADVSWLPDVGDRWFNHKLKVVGNNGRRFSEHQGDFIKAWVAAMPTALFVMMPLFALMLRLLYVRRGHGVLEHLVVALYSHAFMLLSLVAIFALASIGGALIPAVNWIFYVAMTAAIVYIPIYLLLMQKRVYGQGWSITLVKYLLIGGAYQFLLVTATTFAALMPFLHGE